MLSQKKRKPRITNRPPNSIPGFLLKTYQILENQEYTDIISWNSSGTAFIIKKPSQFSDKVLPQYFKHNNLASFVRQLNMYDFHKERHETEDNQWSHRLFRKGQKQTKIQMEKKIKIINQNRQLLSEIKRKINDPLLGDSSSTTIIQNDVDLIEPIRQIDNTLVLKQLMTVQTKQQGLEKACSILIAQNNKILAENKLLWNELLQNYLLGQADTGINRNDELKEKLKLQWKKKQNLVFKIIINKDLMAQQQSNDEALEPITEGNVNTSEIKQILKFLFLNHQNASPLQKKNYMFPSKETQIRKFMKKIGDNSATNPESAQYIEQLVNQQDFMKNLQKFISKSNSNGDMNLDMDNDQDNIDLYQNQIKKIKKNSDDFKDFKFPDSEHTSQNEYQIMLKHEPLTDYFQYNLSEFNTQHNGGIGNNNNINNNTNNNSIAQVTKNQMNNNNNNFGNFHSGNQSYFNNNQASNSHFSNKNLENSGYVSKIYGNDQNYKYLKDAFNQGNFSGNGHYQRVVPKITNYQNDHHQFLKQEEVIEPDYSIQYSNPNGTNHFIDQFSSSNLPNQLQPHNIQQTNGNYNIYLKNGEGSTGNLDSGQNNGTFNQNQTSNNHNNITNNINGSLYPPIPRLQRGNSIEYLSNQTNNNNNTNNNNTNNNNNQSFNYDLSWYEDNNFPYSKNNGILGSPYINYGDEIEDK